MQKLLTYKARLEVENSMSEEKWVTGNIGIRVNDVPVEFEITVPASPVKPQRMLPIFQQMANSFVDGGVAAAESEGKSISCKAGCGACCRQPVPISEVEVYQIAELVEAMEEPRRTEIKQRFSEATAHFHKIGWYERFAEHTKMASSLKFDEGYPQGMALVMEYFGEGIPCPFLENESCSIHQNRPVACREYLVTSPAENCSNPTPANIKMVELAIKPSRGLKNLGSENTLSPIGFPVLSRALEIAEAYPDKFEIKPGPAWVKDFFDELMSSSGGRDTSSERAESAPESA